jgi:diguanylate cyclase (GGDEF)-like protein
MQTTTHTLLLVDDDSNLRLLARHGLARAGYQVVEATNGAEALDLFDSVSPDLMLIDVKMPVMDGFETVSAVRQRAGGQSIPLVMLTGSDDNESVNRAFDVGATDFIIKPLKLPILVQRVRYALAGAEREQRLRRIHLEQQSACNLVRLGFWRLQIDTGRLQWSDEAERVLGRSAMLPRTLTELIDEVPSPQRFTVEQGFRQAMDAWTGVDLELKLTRNDDECIIKMQSSQKVDEGFLIGAFQDVTALRAFEDQALYLMEHDELTSLPNQKLFTRLLQERLNRPHGGDAEIALLVIDIERLHRINDAFGPAKGDEVLAIVAGRLRQAVPSDGLLCRLESDSFGVAVPAYPSRASELRRRLEDSLARPVQINGRDIFADCTVGIACYPDDGSDALMLIQAAQAAERETGRDQHGSFVHFSEVRVEVQAGRVIIEAELRRALENNEFVLYYQPQQTLSDQRIVGVEALLRWNHPERGLVSPGEFVPILEETGLIADVGDWVLAEAVRQAAQWHQHGVPLRVSVNLAPVQVENPRLVTRMCDLIDSYPISADTLELEITETTAMQSPEQTLLNLRKYKDSGFRVAIDDFGTGYSSLAYLLQFPLDTLKIDRAFVKNITRDKRNRAIISALTTLSFHLGLTTIAEGVETRSQRDYMDALNVEEIQGFFLARPLGAEQVEPFLSRHESETRAAAADEIDER